MHLLHLTYHTAQLSAVVLRSVSCLLIIMLGGWLAATCPHCGRIILLSASLRKTKLQDSMVSAAHASLLHLCKLKSHKSKQVSGDCLCVYSLSALFSGGLELTD
jgi:hypothetical protein